MEKGNDKEVTSLLLVNDFSDFRDFNSEKRKRSSDSSNSTRSSVDSDVRDALYAHLYFKDQSQVQEDSFAGSSDSSSAVPSEAADLIVVEGSKNDVIIVGSTSSPSSSKSELTRDTVSSSAKKRKSKSSKEDRIAKKKPKYESFSERIKNESGSSMEFDSDCEIIEDTDDVTVSVATTGGQAKLVSKMDPDDKWFLVEKDLLGSDQHEELYEFKRYNLKQLKCLNCKQKGHSQSDCPHPKRHTVCYLCGTVDHVSSICPESICQYCFQKSHRGKPCSSSLANPRDYCRRCYMKGHTDRICPEQWRQYHNTTNKSSELYKLDGNQKDYGTAYCCMCSTRGHYGFECNQYRPRGFPLPFTSFIAHYDDYAIRQKRRRREDRDKDDHYHRKRRSGTQIRNDTRDGMPPERNDKSSGRRESSHSRHNQPDHLPLQHRLSLPTSHISPLPSPINQSTPRRSLTDPQYLASTPVSHSSYHHVSIHDRLDPLPQEFHPPPTRSLSFVHTRLPDDIFQPPPLPPRWDSNRQDEYRDFPRTPFPNRSSWTHTQGHSNNSSLSGSYHEREFERGRKRWSQGGDEPPPPPRRRWSMDDYTSRRHHH